MNTDQIKGAVRWLLTLVSGTGLGWLAARNILTAEQLAKVGEFLTSEAVISTIVGIGTLYWSLFTHTPANTVKSAAKLPEVSKVEMMATPAGVAIKDKVGSSAEATVTVAPKGHMSQG